MTAVWGVRAYLADEDDDEDVLGLLVAERVDEGHERLDEVALPLPLNGRHADDDGHWVKERKVDMKLSC